VDLVQQQERIDHRQRTRPEGSSQPDARAVDGALGVHQRRDVAPAHG